MEFRAAILISILCTMHASYAMDIIKKNIHLSKGKKQNSSRYPILNDFFILTAIEKNYQKENNNIPQDVFTYIKRLCLQVRDENFRNTFPHLDEWNDFQIPFHCHHRLTSKQIQSLDEYFKYEPSNIPYPQENRLAKHYTLANKNFYKTFITIPIEIRRCLTQLPQSAQKEKREDLTTTDINEHKIVRVGTSSGDVKAKFIIPEEKPKNVTLDVNR